ncbi:oligosaccharide flippase family protein [Butyrivibrio sp. WCE2006]|uniref:oligosaccharide flippase family protein n=1 Tax=Butyrivibrio sp. WCE2006 TaxID=1410611 RepID=UPI0005D1B148|nr:oligosaccharide flippase family protein [Butyrivibrio sp. WCE2006]
MSKKMRIRPDVVLASAMIFILAIMALLVVFFDITGADGVGFLAAPISLFIIAYCVFICAFESTTREMVRQRLSRGQMLSAKKNVRQLMIISVVFGIVLSLMVAVFAIVFAQFVFHSPRSFYVLLLVSPAFLFLSIQGVLRGYLSGSGFAIVSVVSDAILTIITVITIFFLSNAIYDYGKKVDALMHVNDIAPAYGAIGAALGISLSSIISFIFVVIMVLIRRNDLNELTESSAPVNLKQKNECVKDLIISGIIASTGGLLLFIDECIYLNVAHHLHPQESNIDNWGIYIGQCVALVVFFVFASSIPFVKSWFGVHISIVKKDYKAARVRLQSLIHFEAMLIFPIVIWMMILAKTFNTVIFGKSNEAGIDMVILSIPIIIPGAIIVFQTFLLKQLKNNLIMMSNLILGVVIHLVVLMAMSYAGGFGIHASIAAFAAMFIIQGILGMIEIKVMLDVNFMMVRNIVMPLVAATLAGLVALLIDRLLVNLIGEILTLIIAIVLAFVLYMLLLIVLKSVNRYEVERMPLGDYFAIVSDRIYGDSNR